MKTLIVLALTTFSMQSWAYPGEGGAAMLKAQTWITHFSLEPVVSDRRSITISFPEDGTIHFKVTCKFSQTGMGRDASVELVSPVRLQDNTFEVLATQNNSATNDQGKVCKAFMTLGTYPYVFSWDGTAVTMIHRTYAPTN